MINEIPLDAEQQAAVADFSPESTRLVLGAAGTGKTRALLAAFSHSRRESRKITTSAPSSLMVTFSRTLAKYDSYRAQTLIDDAAANITTSETFFWRALKTKEPRHVVDYDILRRLIPQVNDTGFLSDGELWIEIEEFLFGLNITKDEYIEAQVPRHGLKTGLNRGEREKVWSIRSALSERMTSEGRYSMHFARLRLLGWIANDIIEPQTAGPLFVDESQDMAAAELLCLRRLSGSGLIMAGDSGQSIYGFISPYRRADLPSGQHEIRVLGVNHRNTRPVHALAESYRRSGLSEGENPGPPSRPYRDGPLPNIHTGTDTEALADLLIAHAKYSIAGEKRPPESLGILCSRNAALTRIAGKLDALGIACALVRDENFSFARPGAVRLSTLHSAKGLEFDAVLIYLPELPPAREIDPAYQTRLYANLIYVAMTRAREALEIFAHKSIGNLIPRLQEPYYQRFA